MNKNKKCLRSGFLIGALGFQVAALAQPVAVPPSAATLPATSPAAITASTHALSAADLEAWLDGYFPNALNAGDVAGGVVAVVKDGQVLFEKGYGFADFDKRTPIDPKSTLFRWGSVSKLFTWTAVMQLVEQGKIDLDADVNQYLDFKVAAREGKPVTMRNIMTHTAGFEERLKGITWDGADGDLPLDRYLKEYIPARIYAPGGTPAYSNFAAAMAGYIVARVSGVAFDDYVEKHLLEPLQMSSSTFRQPLPERLKSAMSNGYQAASLPAKSFELVGPAPAGSLSAPGDEMTHFMIAHLQNGRYGSGQILKPQTAEQMHTTALTLMPRMNRMLLGFYEDNYNGHRIIAHGGDTQWFHSDLHLYLDDGVGLLVSVNSIGKGGAAHEILSTLFHDFTDRYLPGATLDGNVDGKTAADHARMIAGRYRVSRRVDSSFVSLLYATQQTTVEDNGDGTISVSSETSPSGVPLRWREIEPFVWREERGKTLLSGHAEGNQVVRFAYGDSASIEVYDRAPLAKSAGWWLPAMSVAVVVLLLTTFAWPIGALVRRHYRVAYSLSGSGARAHRWVRIAALGSSLVFIAWFAMLVAMLSALGLIPKLGGLVALLLLLSPIVFVGGAVIGVWNLWTVAKSGRSLWAKLWALVVAGSLLIVLWAALSFHLIAFKTGF